MNNKDGSPKLGTISLDKLLALAVSQGKITAERAKVIVDTFDANTKLEKAMCLELNGVLRPFSDDKPEQIPFKLSGIVNYPKMDNPSKTPSKSKERKVAEVQALLESFKTKKISQEEFSRQLIALQ